MDDRFSKAKSDPRFIRYKKNASKLKIDDRFKSMLTSKEFNSSSISKVDKYGRSTSNTLQKDLKKYYKLESQEDTEEEEVTQTDGYLLARGEAGVESSSEDDDQVEMIKDMEEEDEHEDGFMSHISQSIPTGDETHRLAIVNLDWDHVSANDIYKLFQGFVPPNGLLKSVYIYPSEFGKERMATELSQGPPSSIFTKGSESSQKEEKLIKEDAGIEYDKIQLRRYEIEKLKYYYAIAEFDSKDTAQVIYEACDGAEFETSGNFLDLRFVPNETEFNQVEAKDHAVEAPIVYTQASFVTRALQHSNVKLTWDQDDSERTKVTRRKFTKQDLLDMDFKTYLASDDSCQESQDEAISKYKSLLDPQDDEQDEQDEEMEITFIPGLSQKAVDLLERKKESESRKNESVFEAQLRKQREKKKERKKKRDEQEDEQVDSDDLLVDPNEDVPMDIEQDPFFQLDDEEFQETSVKSTKKSKKQDKEKKSKKEKDGQSSSRQELELLLMDEQDSRHFDVKSIIKSEKLDKNKRKRKRKQDTIQGDVQDDFDLDLKDTRFANVLKDHQFAIDPMNPQFKKTKAMEKILEMRREQRVVSVGEMNGEKQVKVQNRKPDLSMLVSSIKSKSVGKFKNNKAFK